MCSLPPVWKRRGEWGTFLADKGSICKRQYWSLTGVRHFWLTTSSQILERLQDRWTDWLLRASAGGVTGEAAVSFGNYQALFFCTCLWVTWDLGIKEYAVCPPGSQIQQCLTWDMSTVGQSPILLKETFFLKFLFSHSTHFLKNYFLIIYSEPDIGLKLLLEYSFSRSFSAAPRSVLWCVVQKLLTLSSSY